MSKQTTASPAPPAGDTATPPAKAAAPVSPQHAAIRQSLREQSQVKTRFDAARFKRKEQR